MEDAQATKVYVEDKTDYMVDNMDAAQAEKGYMKTKFCKCLNSPHMCKPTYNISVRIMHVIGKLIRSTLRHNKTDHLD